LNDKKITLGTTTKKIPSAMMAAATTIALVLASAARILGIQKQRSRQKFQRKRIVNKRSILIIWWNYDRNGKLPMLQSRPEAKIRNKAKGV
jgi:hypothetical protein